MGIVLWHLPLSFYLTLSLYLSLSHTDRIDCSIYLLHTLGLTSATGYSFTVTYGMCSELHFRQSFRGDYVEDSILFGVAI